MSFRHRCIYMFIHSLRIGFSTRTSQFQKTTQAQWINVHFAWRPRWTTAEQVHKGAHTYTSAHNALHTCTTCAFMHCSDRIAHVSMCDATRLFTHAHSCPLGINTSNSICELFSRVVHAISNASLRIGFIKNKRWTFEVHIMDWMCMTNEDQWMDAGQAQTRCRPSGCQAGSGLGLHLVYTWSTHGLQIGVHGRRPSPPSSSQSLRLSSSLSSS